MAPQPSGAEHGLEACGDHHCFWISPGCPIAVELPLSAESVPLQPLLCSKELLTRQLSKPQN